MSNHDTTTSKSLGERKSTLALLILIILIGLALRIWGIRWGLPSGQRLGTYHPDELVLLSASSSINLMKLQLNPHFYNYPSLLIYLLSLTFSSVAGRGLLNSGRVADLYIVARLLCALFGVISIYAVFLAGKRLYNTNAGLIAAGILAIMPLHVQHSHFLAVDVPAAFFVTATLGAAAFLLRDARLRTYILAGALAGLAAGTKYNCGLIFLSVITAGIFSAKAARRNCLIPLVAALFAAILAFIFVTPGAILWPQEFLRGFTYEFSHAASGHGYVFEAIGPGWLYTLTNSLGKGMGWPLLILSLFAAVYALLRRRREDLVILAFVVPYYLIISLSAVHFARYVLPLLPPLAILISTMVANLKPKIGNWGGAAFALVILYTLTYTIALDRLFVVPDPRDVAVRVVEKGLNEGASIAVPTVPWFYSPPLVAGFGSLSQSERFASMAHSKYHLIADPNKDWNVELVQKLRPEYIIISDYELVDAVRANAPGARNYMKFVQTNYQLIKVFRNRLLPPIFGATMSLPHDMRYAAPEIEVYRATWQR